MEGPPSDTGAPGGRAAPGSPPADSPDAGPAEAHFPAVYAQLRALAGRYLAGGGALTLQPTALVHEAYLRLAGAGTEGGPAWRDRAHFCALAARAMRQALVDHLRRRRADKRGGDWERVTLTGVLGHDPGAGVDVLALESALERLQALDARQARIVELRFYGGLSVPEAAQVLGVSTSTVEKEWRAARAFLGLALSEPGPA